MCSVHGRFFWTWAAMQSHFEIAKCVILSGSKKSDGHHRDQPGTGIGGSFFSRVLSALEDWRPPQFSLPPRNKVESNVSANSTCQCETVWCPPSLLIFLRITSFCEGSASVDSSQSQHGLSRHTEIGNTASTCGSDHIVSQCSH